MTQIFKTGLLGDGQRGIAIFDKPAAGVSGPDGAAGFDGLGRNHTRGLNQPVIHKLCMNRAALIERHLNSSHQGTVRGCGGLYPNLEPLL